MAKKQKDWRQGLALYISGTGLEWTGKGKMPSWLRDEIDSGYDLIEYLNPTHPDYMTEKFKLYDKMRTDSFRRRSSYAIGHIVLLRSPKNKSERNKQLVGQSRVREGRLVYFVANRWREHDDLAHLHSATVKSIAAVMALAEAKAAAK